MLYAKGVDEDKLSSGLLTVLKEAERFARVCDFEITSGYREGDERCHGVGKAVDIACSDSTERKKILYGLERAGFKRIGVYTRHIHVDVCYEGFPQDVLWLGGASK